MDADENHPGAATDPSQRTRYTYDEYKRVLTVTNPMGQIITNYYGLDWANPLLHTTNSVKYTLSPMRCAWPQNPRHLSAGCE